MIALALLLDAVFGEPRWLWTRAPHPAVLMGRAIGWADTRFNYGTARRVKGAVLVAALLLASCVIGVVLQALPWPLQAVIAAILLAQRALVDHVQRVADALRLSVREARRAVAMIVGRDTSEMEAPAIARAAIESAA
ncbi:MAG: cobalamin biosynthesis protein, partial [Pseudomonadota bacterium]